MSRKIANIPFIEGFFGEKVSIYSREIPISQIKGVVGWGLKETAKKARELSKRYGVPYISIEDGFICSYGLRMEGYPPLSLVIDPIGIYYDAKNPSFLEYILKEKKFSKEDLKVAEKALEEVLRYNISKYNYQPMADPNLIEKGKAKKVLVIDQTYGDLSVVYGLANEKTFQDMLDTAIKENPEADIYIKVHPDVISGKKKGYLNKVNSNNLHLITQDVNSLSLLRYFDKVYTVSSQMGFEALLLGKKVICFGAPFYAGWGLTEDKIEIPRRKQSLSLIELFCGAYIKYCCYINPITGKKGSIFDVIEFILKQREFAEKIGRYDYYCVDFHIARRSYVKPFLKTVKNSVYFVGSKDLKDLKPSERSVLVVWGSESRKKVKTLVEDKFPIITVEDGFIRSYGLGADFVPPMSLVFDSKGIYYDPSQESELEHILNNHTFSKEELEEAEEIRRLIVEKGITKYNLPQGKTPCVSTSKKVILVVGQVEEDQAVLLSGGDIKSNHQLLRRVRELNPDSYIIYKPHPDVLSKNRKGSKLSCVKGLADHVELEADITSCIKVADEVHVISSLSGFEALLREKKVFTYGTPFYGGWGLTQDYVKIQRRYRKLTLQELVAGVLLLYPVYYDWKLRGFVNCKAVINRIVYEKERSKLSFKTTLPRPIKKMLNYINFLAWRISTR